MLPRPFPGRGSLSCYLIEKEYHCDTTCFPAMAAVYGGPGLCGLFWPRGRRARPDAAAGAAVIFTLRSSAPLDKGLCARLLASLAPDYEGFELRINNLFGYATLDEAGLRELMEEMKRDGVPINGFLDRCRITITGQNITIGVCHGTKFLQEMQFERLLAERIAAHTGVKPRVTLESSVGEAEQRQMEEKLERKIAPPVVKFEKKNTAPSIKVEGLDLTDKPVTIFHGKMFTPKNLTPLRIWAARAASA